MQPPTIKSCLLTHLHPTALALFPGCSYVKALHMCLYVKLFPQRCPPGSHQLGQAHMHGGPSRAAQPLKDVLPPWQPSGLSSQHPVRLPSPCHRQTETDYRTDFILFVLHIGKIKEATEKLKSIQNMLLGIKKKTKFY